MFLTLRWKKERFYQLERKPAQSLEIHTKRTSSGKRTPVTAASMNSKWKLPRAATGTHLHCEATGFAKSCDLANILPQWFSSYEVWMWTPARVTTVCLKATMAAPREVSGAADVEHISAEAEQNVALGPFSISKRLIYFESTFPFPWKGKHVLLDLT